MKFNLIVCDSPWSFSDKLTMSDVARGAESNYSVLNNEDLLNLKIKELADPNGAILALWVPSSLIELGVQCMNKYGFSIKQTYIWVKIKNDPMKNLFKNLSKKSKDLLKDPSKSNLIALKKIIKSEILNYSIHDNVLRFGMGRLFRQTHEICLIGINNNNIYKLLENKSQRSVSLHKSFKHSKKPEHLQDSLDIMFPNKDLNRLELFARRSRDNWVCIGNESPTSLGQDIRDSIDNLLNK